MASCQKYWLRGRELSHKIIFNTALFNVWLTINVQTIQQQTDAFYYIHILSTQIQQSVHMTVAKLTQRCSNFPNI